MFRALQNDKIGSLLNYLSANIQRLSMTKALKLLYLIDETAYARTGVPVTWMDYKVWEMGPVAEELYDELRQGRYLFENGKRVSLEDYIKTTKESDQQGGVFIIIEPVGTANMEGFSIFEKELIDNIIDRFGTYTSAQLIKLLHEEDTLWHKEVKDNNLALNFTVYGKKSNHTIDFSPLIKDDPIKQLAAQAAFESMQLQQSLKDL
jgi:uncharacterized phage-associated protein